MNRTKILDLRQPIIIKKDREAIATASLKMDLEIFTGENRTVKVS